MPKSHTLSDSFKHWDLNQWLVYLEQKSPRVIELGLERITRVAEELNLLNPSCTVITVAGTNGKGSTVNALETIYHKGAYRVGSYTSPHLIAFNERIKVNLIPISDADLCRLFCIIEPLSNKIAALTYFEITTLAALLYFKEQNLDIMILEVGLGGRLDATNIIDSNLAIITTIDYDHQDYLGETLDAIAYEKAGIMRPNKPVIYADINPPESILKRAQALDSPLYLYNKDFYFNEHGELWDLIDMRGVAAKLFNHTLQALPKPQIQLKSASAAIIGVSLLERYLSVSKSTISKAMNAVFVTGRLQLARSSKDGVSILFDVSHNPQSARLLAQTLKTRFFNAHASLSGKQEHPLFKIHAVFSALKDKDIYNLIVPMKDCIDRWYPAQLDNNRAASADYLLAQCKKAQIAADICYNSPLIAFNEALKQAEYGDLIVVFGSFFTVAQVMALGQEHSTQKGIQ